MAWRLTRIQKVVILLQRFPEENPATTTTTRTTYSDLRQSRRQFALCCDVENQTPAAEDRTVMIRNLRLVGTWDSLFRSCAIGTFHTTGSNIQPCIR